MIRINGGIHIGDEELHWEFVRSSGPGGQHVNKVATAVQLSFDVMSSPSLPREVKDRLRRIAGRRMTDEGVLMIRAQRFRSQERNRTDALARLRKLIEQALEKPRRRIRTQPTASSRIVRMESKRKAARKKRLRVTIVHEDS
ncbi:MAG TPA: aminoacyl-tRNA hydrolase [Deltaproteobacteria bacterium]|nr:aminoacyl-tRNA hydrolase [Deltaproteobacteria bacterium]